MTDLGQLLFLFLRFIHERQAEGEADFSLGREPNVGLRLVWAIQAPLDQLLLTSFMYFSEKQSNLRR